MKASASSTLTRRTLKQHLVPAGGLGLGLLVQLPADLGRGAVDAAHVHGPRDGHVRRELLGPRDRPRVTTDQLADIVMEGLAEERFLINIRGCSRSSRSRRATATP